MLGSEAIPAAELVQLNVDAIVAQSSDSVRSAMKATKSIPIVMFIPSSNAIDFVISLERPGGNVTGISGLTAELGGKWLELVKETVRTPRNTSFKNKEKNTSFHWSSEVSRH